MRVDYGHSSKINSNKVTSRVTEGKSPDTVSYNLENSFSEEAIPLHKTDEIKTEALLKNQLNIESIDDDTLIFSPAEIDQIENELNGKSTVETPILTEGEIQWIDRFFMDPIEAIDREFQCFLDCLREVKHADNRTLDDRDIEYAKSIFYQLQNTTLD